MIELYNDQPFSEIPTRNLQVSIYYSVLLEENSKDQSVMEAAKEKVLNIGATAKAGMDKTKATAEEKVGKMKTRDPLQKEMAEDRKDEKIRQAELEKQQAFEQNSIQKGEGHHTGVGHQAGLGGHHTGVGHHTGLDEPTGGATGLHRTHAPVTGTNTNLTGHHTGTGL